MPKALIKVSYTQQFDANAKTGFEKSIVQASFTEYKMKQQAYNTDGSITRFTELKKKDGRANSLHYKSGFAVGGIIQSLQNKITVVQDGVPFELSFDIYRFEVLESDITDISFHKVAVHYISGIMTLYEIIGNYLLVSYGAPPADNQAPATTFLLKVQPGMNITEYQSF